MGWQVIRYVSFREPINIGGDWPSIQAWSLDKHGASIKLEEKGNWIVMTCADGTRRRVPLTNVNFVSETQEKQEK